MIRTATKFSRQHGDFPTPIRRVSNRRIVMSVISIGHSLRTLTRARVCCFSVRAGRIVTFSAHKQLQSNARPAHSCGNLGGSNAPCIHPYITVEKSARYTRPSETGTANGRDATRRWFGDSAQAPFVIYRGVSISCVCVQFSIDDTSRGQEQVLSDSHGGGGVV